VSRSFLTGKRESCAILLFGCRRRGPVGFGNLQAPAGSGKPAKARQPRHRGASRGPDSIADESRLATKGFWTKVVPPSLPFALTQEGTSHVQLIMMRGTVFDRAVTCSKVFQSSRPGHPHIQKIKGPAWVRFRCRNRKCASRTRMCRTVVGRWFSKVDQ